MNNYKLSLLTVLVLICPVSFADDYRILVTNDDGIESPFLIALADALAANYDVVVSAPRENQSGSSHATSSSAPLKVEKIYRDGKFFGYGAHGRPADAARFGIFELGKDKPFDLVVSGINRGANVGKVAHLSGTVGAAMEGLYQGIPAIAVSQDARANTDVSIQLTLQSIKQIIEHGLPAGTMLSINVPAGDIKQVAVKPMGGSYLGFRPYRIVEQDEMSITYQSGLIAGQRESADNDTRAYQQGIATITPLTLDLTDRKLLGELSSWTFQVSE